MHHLSLQIILILGRFCDVPSSGFDLLVCRDEVPDKIEDGHDHVFSNRDDVGSGHFGNGDAAVGLVRCVEVDMI